MARLTNSLLSVSNSSSTPKNRKARNLAAFLALIASPTISPSDALIFTDGGARPNPGPCGAGALIIHPLNNKRNILDNPHTRLYQPLGHGSNNLGEVYAVGLSAHYFVSEGMSPPPTAFHFFVDSQFAIRAITSLCKDRKYIPISRAVKTLLNALPGPRHFYQIAGHSDNPGGNIADKLATTAIQISTSSNTTVVLPPRAPFLYHKLPP